ncbi:putative RHO guanyl-nucleotide exchange factor, partial [Operophtera brumata]
EFCSRHRDAVDVFKECCARDARLARFIRKCQTNPLLRKKRLTKYPLLLEPLLKTAGDDMHERELLQKALCGVKGRSKMQTLLVIVLTDVLFFLHDNNNKYTFFTPDNKLLVREKAGAEGRGLYLICSGASEPEMFELRVHRPKDIHVWIQNIRDHSSTLPHLQPRERARDVRAAGAPPQGHTRLDTEHTVRQRDHSSTLPHLQRRERARDVRAAGAPPQGHTQALRAKDREYATLLEEKMALHLKLAAHTGTSMLDIPNTGISTVFPGGLVFPDYMRLAAPSQDTHALWQEVCKVVKEALEVTSSTWSPGGALGRSTSSAGERHSSTYESPALPRRADTFAGFDASRHRGRSTSSAGERHSSTYESPALPRRADTFAGFDASRHRARRGSGTRSRTRAPPCRAARTPSQASTRPAIEVHSEQLATNYPSRSPRAEHQLGGGAALVHVREPRLAAPRGHLRRLRRVLPSRYIASSFRPTIPHGALRVVVSCVVPRLSTDTPTEVTESDAEHIILDAVAHAPLTDDAALRLQHAVYTLTCIVWQQLTTIHSCTRRSQTTRRSACSTPTTRSPASCGSSSPLYTGLCHQLHAPLTDDTALRLQHAVYTLTCIVWQQLTTIHSLEAQVCAWRSSGGALSRTHDAQLEELRHAQARLTAERANWEAQKNADYSAIAAEKRQLQAARQELSEQQRDVEQQRERLYRRLERLQQHASGKGQQPPPGYHRLHESPSDVS